MSVCVCVCAVLANLAYEREKLLCHPRFVSERERERERHCEAVLNHTVVELAYQNTSLYIKVYTLFLLVLTWY